MHRQGNNYQVPQLKREQLADRNVDCLALIPGANMKYMTGVDFHLMERPIIGLFFPEERPLFLTPDFEKDRLSAMSVRAATYSDSGIPAVDVLGQALALLDQLPQSVAVEFLTMRVLEQQMIKQHLPDMILLNGDPIMSSLREKKSAQEVEAIKQAIAITEAALEAVISTLKPGLTEKQLAEQLSAALRERGGEAPPFDPIVLGSTSTQ
jgi:Xaa-Pro dipeptidase